mmetsp:Transcript_21294/g.38777  ORF Transcript_21294/g.38777 Transcript_21294/m.38777 type:complete len:209 (-) Transcript_21294:389-1015(-)
MLGQSRRGLPRFLFPSRKVLILRQTGHFARRSLVIFAISPCADAAGHSLLRLPLQTVCVFRQMVLRWSLFQPKIFVSVLTPMVAKVGTLKDHGTTSRTKVLSLAASTRVQVRSVLDSAKTSDCPTATTMALRVMIPTLQRVPKGALSSTRSNAPTNAAVKPRAHIQLSKRISGGFQGKPSQQVVRKALRELLWRAAQSRQPLLCMTTF